MKDPFLILEEECGIKNPIEQVRIVYPELMNDKELLNALVRDYFIENPVRP